MEQVEMNNAGTVFHNGPVVRLIVDNLPFVDKVNLLKQIEEENKKRPPGTTNPMSGWKEAIARALNNQRVISNYTDTDRFNSSEFADICFTHQDFTDATNVIPDQWLANEEEFERLLLLCPNLRGIRLIGTLNAEELNYENILDIILRHATNLASLTFDIKFTGPIYWTLKQILRKRKSKMEYIDVSSYDLALDYAKELIETNPNLTAICTGSMKMNFVDKYLYMNEIASWEWTRTNRIVELCNFFKRYNSHYKESSSNGVKLKGIWISCVLDRDIFVQLLDSFRQLEFLSLTYPPDVDIRQLQVMKEMKSLRLIVSGNYDDSIYFEELLPHLQKLEELHLENVSVSESTLTQLHIPCRHLRKLTINHYSPDFFELSVETLRGICQLANLEYFELNSPYRDYKWVDRNSIDEKRRKLSVELRPHDLAE